MDLKGLAQELRTRFPLDLTALMRTLDQEYREFVGEGDEEEKALPFSPPSWKGTGPWPMRFWRPYTWQATWKRGTAPSWYCLFFRFPEALRLFS